MKNALVFAMLAFAFASVGAKATTAIRKGGGTFLRTRRNVAARAVLGKRKGRAPGGGFTFKQRRNALKAARPQTIR